MQLFINIVFLSSFYLSFALGLTIIFGVMRVINYAHGEIFMLGGYTMLLVIWALGGGTLPSLAIVGISIAAATVVACAIGALQYFVIVKRLQDQPLSIFLATLGLSYVIQVAVISGFGPMGRSFPVLFPGFFRFAGAVIPYQRLIVLGLTLAMLGLLAFFLLKTRTGLAIRAASQNRTGALLQGVDLGKISIAVMFLGCSIAAISGVLLGSLLNVSPFMGGEAIWRAFVVIIVGGIGSLGGAALAAVLFGVIDSTLTFFGFTRFVSLVDAVAMLLILAFLPYGLLGQKE